MRVRSLVRVLCCLAILGGATGAHANPPAFTAIGPEGATLTGLSTDMGGLFAFTADGFHRYRETTRSWDPFVEPGIPGREVTAIQAHLWLDVPAVAGRLGADGHGYLTVEHFDGAVGPTTHISTGGAVAAIVADQYWFPTQVDLWAVTRAGSGPGELLYSQDSGLTWAVVTGHGMTDLTGVQIEERYQQPGVVILAGDQGVVRTLDSGLTWETYDGGLPTGPVEALGVIGPTVASLPIAKSLPHPWFLAVLADGLHQLQSTATTWDHVLADDIDLHEASVLGLRRHYVVVLTTDGRLLAAASPYELDWTWEDWSPAFPGMGIVGIGAETRVLVATASNGVWSLPVTSDVPAAPDRLQVRAAPNPFNPATTISWELPEAGHLDVRVFDPRGRLVRTLVAGHREAGPGTVTWHGRDDAGRPMASGVYLVEARGAGGAELAKVTLVE